MNYSEYLRRKMESLPKVYGPPQLRDSSMVTMVQRYKAAGAAVCNPTGPQEDPTCCLGKTPYWRTLQGGGRPDSGPFRRAADGQQQEWSFDGRRDAAAGAAVCGTGRVGYVYQACCPQESTPEIPRDGAGVPTDPLLKAAAYKGKQTCCPYQGLPLYALSPDCSCANPPGYIDTLAANGVPNAEIPVPPAATPCCVITLNQSVEPPCDCSNAPPC